MISVEEAFQHIIGHFRPLPAERVPLNEALDRVLVDELSSPENVPAFDNSAMDGYAVRRADVLEAREDNPIALRVLADLAAGYTAKVKVEPGTAIRIMTGAPIPEGADAVVMREETREAPKAENSVEILVAPEEAENIRRAGEDIRRGSRVMPAGAVVSPAAIGVMASIGLVKVEVVRRPRVALLATRDELVEVGQPLQPGQIRASSSYALEALIRQMGAVPVNLGIAKDDPVDLRVKILKGTQCDMLITTGGVSVGDYDLVKEILADVGQMNLWKVNKQPGKPQAIGVIDGTPVVGLPGNPVSSLVAFEVFVRPAIRRMQGHKRLHKPPTQVELLGAYDKRNERRQFLRAQVHMKKNAFIATLGGAQGSHQLSGVARANGLVVLPEGKRQYAAGDHVDGFLLDVGDIYSCWDPELS
jgi:molybdopterin molybdotransferase